MHIRRFLTTAGSFFVGIMLVTAAPLWAQRGGRAGMGASAPMEFRALGPVAGGGRVCCVVGIPGQPNIYYVGSAGGGVWKTTNGGFSWTPIFSHEATESIGALALAPSDPDLVWVGTGESNVRNDVIDGHGLYFSPDGGQTWKEIGAQYFAHAGQISKIVINPQNADEVWVAVLGHAFGPNPERGVYHTTDGGASWQKTLFVNDSTGAIDLALQPGNPRVLIAAMWQTIRHPWALEDGGAGSGLYKSVDGGVTWKQLSAGLPAKPYGRIAVEFAPSEPSLLYAEIQAKRGVFWRSEDAGAHWTMVSNDYQLNSRPFYFSRFEVVPNNPEHIFFLSVRMSYSADGGRTSAPSGITLHADHHTMWIDPANPKRIIEGDDGGVNLSSDGGLHWIHPGNLALEEGYSIHIDGDNPYHICEGLQDNGGWCGPSQAAATGDWHMVVGGDGEYVVPAPSDANVLYADSQEGDIERTDIKTGVSFSVKPKNRGTSGETNFVYRMPARFNWTTPIEVSATDPNTVYLGSNRLYKTTNGGHDWTPISPDLTRNDKSKQQASGGVIDLDMTGAETYDTILSISLCPTDANSIWVGTDDGNIQVTHDGGKTWARVSDNLPKLPGWGRYQEMECSPFDANSAYVAYDLHEMDNDHPYVFKTTDSGKTWSDISAGLPSNYSATVVREDPNQKGLLILGTYYGLYRSLDDGAHWTQIHNGFPTAVVYDLKFVKRDHSLVVGTHGRGIFVMDNLTPWEQEAAHPAVSDAAFTVFPILDAYRYQRLGGGGGGGLGGNPFAVRVAQPPQGAVIQYKLKAAVHSSHPPAPAPAMTAQQRQMMEMAAEFGFSLPTASRGPVTVDVTDSQGHHIATIHAPGRAGLNQAVWNGDYDPSPVQAPAAGGRGGFFGRFGGGLAALPGRYKVTVNVPGLPPQSQWVNLHNDPRVPESMAVLAANLRAAQAMQPDVDAMNRVLIGLNSLNHQLGSLQTNLRALAALPGYPALLHQAAALHRKVTDLQNKFIPAPRHEDYGGITEFQAEFSGIFRRISGNRDGMPVAQDLRDWATDRVKLAGYINQYNQILKTDVPAFNKAALASRGVTLAVGEAVSLPARPQLLSSVAAATTTNR